jgi:hypothetical protein
MFAATDLFRLAASICITATYNFCWMTLISHGFPLKAACPQNVHRHLWIDCGKDFLLVTCNDKKSRIDAACGGASMPTMKAQQAVAKRSVGRRVPS